ncbi:MAG: glutamate mutase L, partial [Chloroflexota bacterium]
MGLIYAVDFGSTFTKVVAFDLAAGEVRGVAQALTTAHNDITLGLQQALTSLEERCGLKPEKADRFIACSSAAGGLRVVAVGLIPALTAKAAAEAALGAGAKIVGTFAHGLSREDMARVQQLAPDIIVLAGGTDGGNEEVLLRNAETLSRAELDVPIVIAGNKMAAPGAKAALDGAGKEAVVVANVLPELDRLDVEPTREAIRDIFLRRITHAKGLDRAHDIVGDVIMPTPLAVLKGAT